MVAAAQRISSGQVPPGPKITSILGCGPEVSANPIKFYSRMQREFGDVVRMRAFPSFYWYLISNPSGIERILQTNQLNYPKAKLFIKPMSLMVGQGMLTSEGEFWRRQRRLAQPAFHRQRIAALGETMVDTTEEMLYEWDRAFANGIVFDVADEMMRLTLRIATLTLLSVDSSNDASRIGPALRVAFEHVNHRMSIPWAIPEFIPTPRNRRFNKAKRLLDEIVYSIIRDRRSTGTDTGDLLSMLLMARDEDTGEGMNDQQLRDEVLTIMIAGHETGAAALSWSWYLLGQNPDAEAKLLEELKRVLGGRIPTASDLPNLPYTRMVFEEAMRLYPPAWGLPRQSVEPEEFDGYQIPGKSLVVVSQFVTHRHPEFWDRPNDFIPERFTPENSAQRPRFAYFPFGGGARQCIGNSFAMMEAQLILATVAQRYRIKLLEGHEVDPDPTFTLRPRNGVKVRIERR
jgi:cytochrome P450